MITKRRVLLPFVLAGAAYGFFGAMQNCNPYAGPPRIQPKAWHWEPSPIWITSYALCKFPRNGLGITHTKSGYLFRDTSDKVVYFGVSTLMGVVLGIAVGWCLIRIAFRSSRGSKCNVSGDTGED